MKIEKELNNTHTTTQKRTMNNVFRNTKKHSNKLQYVLKLEQHLTQGKNLPCTKYLNEHNLFNSSSSFHQIV